MITSVLLFWPASRGVAIVVASTASTVPDKRSARTKSPRFSTVVADAGPAACAGVRAPSDRLATARPPAPMVATRAADFSRDMARISDGQNARLVGHGSGYLTALQELSSARVLPSDALRLVG